MAILAGRNVSLKTSKLAIVLISLVGVLSTLYVYDYDSQSSSLARAMKRRIKDRPPQRKLFIWLMGYPGAGSDQTMNIIEYATGKSMATNYGDVVQTKDMKYHKRKYVSEWLQKSWYKEGGFINNIDLPADTSEVYVKTFCTGYCLYHKDHGFCDRIPYVRSLGKIGKFWTECSRGDINLPPRTHRWNKTYWKNRVKKILVLVRNPLEIVGSRYMEYARENAEKRSWRGLLPFCDMIDNLYGYTKELNHVKSSRWIKPYIEGVPCWTEFYRIFVWYGHVWKLANRRESMVKFREDFINDSTGTVSDILSFAGLSRMEDRDILPIGDEVDIMFSEEEKEKIAQFMQSIGKFDSWMWKHYFTRYFSDNDKDLLDID